jgi:uncharacterized protein (TIGR02302 family)
MASTTDSGGDPRQAPGFRQRLLAARAFVWFERLWPAAWPAVAVLGVFAAASLFGLWYGLPRPLHALLLLLFAAALGAALWHARRSFAFADRLAGLARLERDSDARHQPLRGLDDTLPEDVQDPVTRRLWAMHRERLVAGLSRLRLAPPRSLLPARDPWALRSALLLVLVVALVHARGEVGPRLASAFAFVPQATAAAVPPRLDLWVTPPAYTRRPPLASEQTRGQRTLSVPAGSVALAQLHHQAPADGAAPPRLEYGEAGGGGAPFEDLGGGSAEARVELREDAYLTARGPDGAELGSWYVDVAPDAPPAVSFVDTPRPTHRGVLRIGYEATDDYGVAELAMLLAPKGREGEVERLGLVKPASQPAKLASGSFLDLTAHPLAGLPVLLRLEAADGLGQKGLSGPLEVVLPAREFRHPLARAIIEQRRELAREPGTAPDVAGRLAALAETRTAQELPSSVPLSLRVAAARLSFNQDQGSRRDVIDLLWELALFIEDGALSVAERKLRELQEELQRALQEGAPDSEIERMLEELQQALNEFLDQLTEQALSQMQQDPGQQQQMAPQDGQTVERRDLQEMLDRAREMLRSGAKDAAREMLAQLQQMLENLRAGTMQAQQQPSQGEQALSDLQKMIQLQQNLLERSFQMDRQQRSGEQGQQGQQQQQGRQQQGQRGQQGQQGQQQQQGGQQGQQQAGQQPGDQMGQAAAEQDALRRALGELMRRLGEAGMEIPRALGQAELEMRNARGALEGEQPGTAAEAQTQAVDSMQQAGQAMMEQLREQMAQQQGQQPGAGPGGQPMPQAGRRGRDPLGRAQRNEGGFDTQGVQVPEESDLGRARDVLEELYRRAGDQRRPPSELDYFRRLLDRF